jgi:hypothetical protein
MVAVVTAIMVTAHDARMDTKRAKTVSEEQGALMAKQAADQERAYNKANAKKPNMAALMSSNRSPIAGGTMLTGAQGIDPSRLTIGKTSLLGG